MSFLDIYIYFFLMLRPIGSIVYELFWGVLELGCYFSGHCTIFRTGFYICVTKTMDDSTVETPCRRITRVFALLSGPVVEGVVGRIGLLICRRGCVLCLARYFPFSYYQ